MSLLKSVHQLSLLYMSLDFSTPTFSPVRVYWKKYTNFLSCTSLMKSIHQLSLLYKSHEISTSTFSPVPMSSRNSLIYLLSIQANGILASPCTPDGVVLMTLLHVYTLYTVGYISRIKLKTVVTVTVWNKLAAVRVSCLNSDLLEKERKGSAVLGKAKCKLDFFLFLCSILLCDLLHGIYSAVKGRKESDAGIEKCKAVICCPWTF